MYRIRQSNREESCGHIGTTNCKNVDAALRLFDHLSPVRKDSTSSCGASREKTDR